MERSNAQNAPFKGLEQLRYSDKDLFSGRAIETEQLYNLINIYRGCMLYGKSGVGKSSLISAGLLPLLIKHYQPELIRVFPTKNGSFVLTRILVDEQLNIYHKSIFDVLKEQDGKIIISADEFENILLNLSSEIKEDVVRNKTPILIFDQFEEIVTLFEESEILQSDSNSIDSHDDPILLQSEIVQLIKKIYYAPINIKFLFVFREDYLAPLSVMFNEIPDVNNLALRLKEMSVERIPEIIRSPFDNHRFRFENPFSAQLIKELSDSFKMHFADGIVSLTDVQIVSLFLFKKNAVEREILINQSSPIKLILESFYKEILDHFDKAEKEIAIIILSILVLNEKTRNTFHYDLINQEFKKHYIAPTRFSKITVRSTCDTVLQKLEKESKIITRERRKDGYYYEISSEAIIPYINTQKIQKKTKETESKIKVRAAITFSCLILIASLVIFWLYFNNKQLTSFAIFYKTNGRYNSTQSIQIYERLVKESSKTIRNQIGKTLNTDQFDIGGKTLLVLKDDVVSEQINDTTYRFWKIISSTRIKLIKEYKNVTGLVSSFDNSFTALYGGNKLHLFNALTLEDKILYHNPSIGKLKMYFSKFSNFLTFYSEDSLYIYNPSKGKLQSIVPPNSNLIYYRNLFGDSINTYNVNGNTIQNVLISNGKVISNRNYDIQDTWNYLAGDSIIEITRGKIDIHNLQTGGSKNLSSGSYTKSIVNTQHVFVYYNWNNDANSQVFYSWFFYDIINHKSFRLFDQPIKKHFIKYKFNVHCNEVLLNDNIGSVYLIPIFKNNAVNAGLIPPLELADLKNCLDFTISNNGKYIFYVMPASIENQHSVKKINVQVNTRNLSNKFTLFRYTVETNKSQFVDSITRDEFSILNSRNSYFKIDYESTSVAYKKSIGQQVSLVVKNIQSQKNVYVSKEFTNYKNDDMDFRKSYIHLADRNNSEGIILLNGIKSRNLQYFERIGIPSLSNSQWNRLKSRFDLGF